MEAMLFRNIYFTIKSQGAEEQVQNRIPTYRKGSPLQIEKNYSVFKEFQIFIQLFGVNKEFHHHILHFYFIFSLLFFFWGGGLICMDI